jgi:hypothetical protein
MTAYTTTTRELGQITFTAPAAGADRDGYVYLETANGKRLQICYGGGFRGNNVTAKSGDLKKTSQAWLRQRREWQRKLGA